MYLLFTDSQMIFYALKIQNENKVDHCDMIRQQHNVGNPPIEAGRVQGQRKRNVK